MANDLAAMKARIASELVRTDLTAHIANAINDAISIHQKTRYRFNVTDPSSPITFNTVAAQFAYGAADNAAIPLIHDIDWVKTIIGNTLTSLSRVTPEEIIAMSDGTMSGQPSSFAYDGNKLLLSATPDRAYVIKIGAHLNLAAPAADDEANNAWMIAAERLIRAQAKRLIAVHVTRNPSMAEAMDREISDAKRELKSDSNRIVARGVIRSPQF